jgi:hypothetical protein
LLTEEWKTNGDLHREEGPALVVYFVCGNVEYQSYYIKDVQHREDGPSYTEYYRGSDGAKRVDVWRKEGKKHREDGPAEIWYRREDGSAKDKTYWIRGKEMGFWEFYGKVSEENQKVLLKNWLHHHA